MNLSLRCGDEAVLSVKYQESLSRRAMRTPWCKSPGKTGHERRGETWRWVPSLSELHPPQALRKSTSNVNLGERRSQKVRRLGADRCVYRKHKVRDRGPSVWSRVHTRARRLNTWTALELQRLFIIESGAGERAEGFHGLLGLFTVHNSYLLGHSNRHAAANVHERTAKWLQWKRKWFKSWTWHA